MGPGAVQIVAPGQVIRLAARVAQALDRRLHLLTRLNQLVEYRQPVGIHS